ncbi:uncharacterized protein KZ484_010800 isoform 2-T2 [Pholidichthys leucotaenia]
MTSVSGIKSHRLDVPQQNQEEVLDEQQLLNQERNFIVVQVEADCSQIKQEQEDICISQGGEQFGLKQEIQTSNEDGSVVGKLPLQMVGLVFLTASHSHQPVTDVSLSLISAQLHPRSVVIELKNVFRNVYFLYNKLLCSV